MQLAKSVGKCYSLRSLEEVLTEYLLHEIFLILPQFKKRFRLRIQPIFLSCPREANFTRKQSHCTLHWKQCIHCKGQSFPDKTIKTLPPNSYGRVFWSQYWMVHLQILTFYFNRSPVANGVDVTTSLHLKTLGFPPNIKHISLKFRGFPLLRKFTL